LATQSSDGNVLVRTNGREIRVEGGLVALTCPRDGVQTTVRAAIDTKQSTG